MQADVETLLKQLRGGWLSSAEGRLAAATRLGQLRVSHAVEPLILALGDRDGAVRARAAWALGELRDPRSLSALVGAIEDENRGVYLQATLALLKILRAIVEIPQDAPTILRIGERAASFVDSEDFTDLALDVIVAAYDRLLPLGPVLSLNVVPPDQLRSGEYSAWHLQLANSGGFSAVGLKVDVGGPWEQAAGALGDLAAGEEKPFSLSLCTAGSGEAVPLYLSLSYVWLPAWCEPLSPSRSLIHWNGQYAVSPPAMVEPTHVVYQAGGDIILPGGAKAQTQEGVAMVRQTPARSLAEKPGEASRFCRHCGHELDLFGASSFCTACGQRISG